MKKGFTLIELLAVIIILAIVALIATPIILDVVEDARKSAAKSEASMILNGIQTYCAAAEAKKQLNPDADVVDCTTTISAEDVKEMANLGSATVSSVTPETDGTYSLYVKSNGYLIGIYKGVIPTSYTKTTTDVPATAPTTAQ